MNVPEETTPAETEPEETPAETPADESVETPNDEPAEASEEGGLMTASATTGTITITHNVKIQ